MTLTTMSGDHHLQLVISLLAFLLLLERGKIAANSSQSGKTVVFGTIIVCPKIIPREWRARHSKTLDPDLLSSDQVCKTCLIPPSRDWMLPKLGITLENRVRELGAARLRSVGAIIVICSAEMAAVCDASTPRPIRMAEAV